MSTLSTHVLDTAVGQPAKGIPVTLIHEGNVVGSGTTDQDGRVQDLQEADQPLLTGSYQLRFGVSDYFAGLAVAAFYSEVVVKFEIHVDDQHYHVPLLLSPFGYSTYRGS